MQLASGAKSKKVNANGLSFIPDQLKNVIGVSVAAWDLLGVERFLPYFKIITVRDRNYDPQMKKYVLELVDEDPLRKKNPRHLLLYLMENSNFAVQGKEMLIKKNSNRLTALAEKLNFRVLSEKTDLAKELENKAEFRILLKGSNCRLPDYIIVEAKTLKADLFPQYFQRFGKMVVQEEKSSSGKGTFFVSNQNEFNQMLKKLQKPEEIRVVISKFIEGEVVSIQACLSKDGCFYYPIQRQITFNDTLCNIHYERGEKFCGGEWGYLDCLPETKQELAVFMKTVGKILKRKKYQGIFGLDLIIDPSGKPYIIEMNARLTGMTTPLAMLCNKNKKLSLMLLHVLERAGVDYQMTPEIINNPGLDGGNQGGYLIVHNNTDQPIKVDRKLVPGVYLRDDQGQFVYSRTGYSYEDLRHKQEFILADVPSVNFPIVPGKRILRVLTLERVLDKNSRLREEFVKLVKQIRNFFIKQ